MKKILCVSLLLIICSGCAPVCEDITGDGECDRIRADGNYCPAYSSSPTPDANGYCYPD
jgi:hypothetical protein